MSGWPVSSSIPAGLLDRVGRDAPDLILAVGNFADDVAIVRHRDRLPASTRLAVVAAGLYAFTREGGAAEGVIGASQWDRITRKRRASALPATGSGRSTGAPSNGRRATSRRSLTPWV
jgi:hypothetical protein